MLIIDQPTDLLLKVCAVLLCLLLLESGAKNIGANCAATDTEGPAPRVAIIGAGIGGTAAAYYLRRQLPNATIDIFESGKGVGGRLATLWAAGREYEIGGSIIHPANRVMSQLRELCGLEPLTENEDDGGFAFVGSNHELIYQTPKWGGSLAIKLSLLLRYGPLSLLRLDNFVGNLLESFAQIYPRLDAGVAYRNLTAMLTDMSPQQTKLPSTDVSAVVRTPEMIQLTQVDLESKLLSLGLSKQLINELVLVAGKVNYGQLPQQLHSLVGAVSLAGVQGHLWRIKGGNYRVPVCLKRLAAANLYLNTTVIEIEKVNSSFRITFLAPDDKNNLISDHSDYDIVIIARPLTADQASAIKLSGLPGPPPLFGGHYHHTFTYLVEGRLNAAHFGTNDQKDDIFFIDPDERLASISRLLPVDHDPASDDSSPLPEVYKIFSRNQLSRQALEKLFVGIESVQEVNWLAYPHYPSNKELGQFELYPGLYHVNAVEWAASAMEMSAIAGWNVANLAADFGNSVVKTRHQEDRHGDREADQLKKPRVEL